MASNASKARPSRHPWHSSSDQQQSRCDDNYMIYYNIIYLKCHQYRCTIPFAIPARTTNSTWLEDVGSIDLFPAESMAQETPAIMDAYQVTQRPVGHLSPRPSPSNLSMAMAKFPMFFTERIVSLGSENNIKQPVWGYNPCISMYNIPCVSWIYGV